MAGKSFPRETGASASRCLTQPPLGGAATTPAAELPAAERAGPRRARRRAAVRRDPGAAREHHRQRDQLRLGEPGDHLVVAADELDEEALDARRARPTARTAFPGRKLCRQRHSSTQTTPIDDRLVDRASGWTWHVGRDGAVRVGHRPRAVPRDPVVAVARQLAADPADRVARGQRGRRPCRTCALRAARVPGPRTARRSRRRARRRRTRGRSRRTASRAGRPSRPTSSRRSTTAARRRSRRSARRR